MRLYEISQKMWGEPFVNNEQPKFYHGTKMRFDHFDPDFLGQGLDQNGPGFYFTNKIEEAKRHAGTEGVILECILTPRRLIRSRGVVSEWLVKYLIKHAPDYLETLSNWDEDASIAFHKAVDAMIVQGDPKETYERVWGDFYRDSSKLYMKIMSKFKYDGVLVPNSESKHIIMMNEAKIKIVRRIDPEEFNKPVDEPVKQVQKPQVKPGIKPVDKSMGNSVSDQPGSQPAL